MEPMNKCPTNKSDAHPNQDAWLTTMKILFPPMVSVRRMLGLGAPRRVSYQFEFAVLVVEEVGLPLLGTGDLLRNFTVTSSWEDCQFVLNPDHLGTPVA